MKTSKVILLVMAVLVLSTYAHALTLGSMRISFLEGDVQMRTTEAGDWVPAAINTPLDEGDELWVPEGGRIEFQFNTGTSVRLDQNSALQILTLERTSSQFYHRGAYLRRLQRTARQRHPVRHPSIILAGL